MLARRPVFSYVLVNVNDKEHTMPVHYYKGDIPANLQLKGDLAIDTEAMGLVNVRDRLCVLQFSDGQGDVHLVHFEPGKYDAPNLKKLLSDNSYTKLFHFARFDVAIIRAYLGVMVQPIYCTKIASKLARTYTDRHGYRDLCKEMLGVDISKQQQSSDWGASDLTEEQLNYAATDVLHLHALRDKLNAMLVREGRMQYATASFNYIPARAMLDLAGWQEVDIFAHS
jgi:ribonuclease D